MKRPVFIDPAKLPDGRLRRGVRQGIHIACPICNTPAGYGCKWKIFRAGAIPGHGFMETVRGHSHKERRDIGKKEIESIDAQIQG